MWTMKELCKLTSLTCNPKSWKVLQICAFSIHGNNIRILWLVAPDLSCFTYSCNKAGLLYLTWSMHTLATKLQCTFPFFFTWELAEQIPIVGWFMEPKTIYKIDLINHRHWNSLCKCEVWESWMNKFIGNDCRSRRFSETILWSLVSNYELGIYGWIFE